MIKRIFLDIDGVLNRFQLHVFKRLGIIAEMLDEVYPVEAGWDIVKAANILSKRDRSKSEFWNSVTRDIWATAPKSAECDWLIGHAEALVGRENVALLTSPTLDPDCAAGKIEWIKAFMPEWLHRQFFIGPKKRQVAHPGALLIDDSDDNVFEWRLCGGEAILVPHRWNSLHELSTRTLDYVNAELQIHTNTPLPEAVAERRFWLQHSN